MDNKKVEKYVQILESKIFFLSKFNLVFVHDTKSVLRKINSLLCILKNQKDCELDKDDQQEIIDYLLKNIKLMNNIFDDMMGFNYKTIPDEKNLVKESIEHVVSVFKEEIKKSNITFHITDLPNLKIKKYDLYRIFQNLIFNSIQHSKADSLRISIQAERINSGCWINYSDNGSGKNVDDERVADIIVSDYHLGERIIQHIINQYGGHCKDYKMKKGYKFSMYIPDQYIN